MSYHRPRNPCVCGAHDESPLDLSERERFDRLAFIFWHGLPFGQASKQIRDALAEDRAAIGLAARFGRREGCVTSG
jgi:hypothetical protein